MQKVFCQHRGALVKVGDSVFKKQPIGLSGMTGYTNIAHLHLNILIPKAGATLISTPIEFEGGIQGHQLKEGAILNNK